MDKGLTAVRHRRVSEALPLASGFCLVVRKGRATEEIIDG